LTETAFQLPVGSAPPVHLRCWRPRGRARCVVLLIHGLGEHGGRYARFAQALNGAGAAVYAPDLPGHGLSAPNPQRRGHFADRGGWDYVMNTVAAAREHARSEHPQLPLFIFGHSLGSFVVQLHIAAQPRDLAGVILSATSDRMSPLRPLGQLVAGVQARLLGPHHRSGLLREATFGMYNRRFAPTRTDYDWLSRDLGEVDRRIADPLTGFTSTVRLWLDFLGAGRAFADPQLRTRLPAELPVLLIAGTEDSVAEDGRGPERLAAIYRGVGLRDVTVRLYAGGRHELLNDLCREEVTADILGWLQQHLPARPARRRRSGAATRAA
jgi:alpha-beta hydrolase superfamily lysophospholipase